jgi:hypothetical protein
MPIRFRPAAGSSARRSRYPVGRQGNGSWYSGIDAKNHLLRKLDCLEKKDLVRSADQLVELGA